VYVSSHTFANAAGVRKAEVFIWSGSASTDSGIASAQLAAKRVLRESGASAPVTIRQGYETSPFLQALGGVVITRRGAPEGASKQYILCGRKHLGHIVFDEVDFGVQSLCAGFTYIISYPVTVHRTKLYLWKGSAWSTEEIGAARLVGMDLSESGEMIEVDHGAEFPSFLKIFGADTEKTSISKSTHTWDCKAQALDGYFPSLFRVQQIEQKVGYFSGLFRRPSWQSRSPSPSPIREDTKMELKRIIPFTQQDLEAEGIYILNAYGQIFVLYGPLFPSQTTNARNTMLGYALLSASNIAKNRFVETAPRALVLTAGIPQEFKMLFRHWDEGRGLWGTGGLMAGSLAHGGAEVTTMPLDVVTEAVCLR
ncbi:hypothetical protein BAUCODRAFT_77772, partial [Baudoinia panamericana UAMH 10762]